MVPVELLNSRSFTDEYKKFHLCCICLKDTKTWFLPFFVVPFSKKIYSQFLILVGPRNRFKSDSTSYKAFVTIKWNKFLYTRLDLHYLNFPIIKWKKTIFVSMTTGDRKREGLTVEDASDLGRSCLEVQKCWCQSFCCQEEIQRGIHKAFHDSFQVQQFLKSFHHECI